ncbi:MAG TPA: flagellar biosynthesis protein FlhF [bacterium]|nr:flagellar biosynthesis protein FlhF [bacterium]
MRFEAPSVQEALRKVRQELGPDAVILYTKKVRRGGFFGLGGGEVSEVTAGVDSGPENLPASALPPVPQAPVQAAPRASMAGPSAPPPAPTALRRPAAAPMRPAPRSPLSDVRRGEVFQSELNDGKVLSGAQITRSVAQRGASDLHPELKKVLEKLLSNGVEEAIAQAALVPVQREIMEKGYPRAGTLGAVVTRALASQLKASGPIEAIPGKPRVIAFIGPTGVGKTTTLVKLASQYALVHQLKVALLTADTYRIGAVEQLRIYRDIMDIPFEAVSSPAELAPALRRYADRDLIFFDTAGRSPQNRRQIQDLKAFLEAAKPAETHLCVSATTKNADLLPIVGKFGLVPVNRFLVTKLDETRSLGLLLNLAAGFQIPISYLGTGQNVPNDIELASPERMAELVMGEGRG